MTFSPNGVMGNRTVGGWIQRRQWTLEPGHWSLDTGVWTLDSPKNVTVEIPRKAWDGRKINTARVSLCGHRSCFTHRLLRVFLGWDSSLLASLSAPIHPFLSLRLSSPAILLHHSDRLRTCSSPFDPPGTFPAIPGLPPDRSDELLRSQTSFLIE